MVAIVGVSDLCVIDRKFNIVADFVSLCDQQVMPAYAKDITMPRELIQWLLQIGILARRYASRRYMCIGDLNVTA